jgi:NADPH:quinone reductase-like Zn-dependent oxidoreductase
VRYAKMARYRVVTMASERNRALVQEAGADVVLDRHDGRLVERLKGELPIDFWFDTIALPESIEKLYELAEEQRRRTGKDVKIVTLLPAGGDKYPKAPEGVTTQMMLFRGGLEENKPHMEWLMGKGGFLETGLKNGTILGVPAEVVGGLDAVPSALEMIDAGVSGKKLVVDPWL